MNLAGKILIVSILVTSILFMAFAMAVYATHKNWRELVNNELTKQLKNDTTLNNDLTAQAEKLKKQFEDERAAKIQALAKLENELVAARKELDQLEAKQTQLETQKSEAVAAMNATQTSTTDLRKELAGQRATADDARKDRDANFKEVVRLTEEVNQAANEKDLLKKRTDELAKDLSKAEQMLRK
jgi:chromosome segregation ATPase